METIADRVGVLYGPRMTICVRRECYCDPAPLSSLGAQHYAHPVAGLPGGIELISLEDYAKTLRCLLESRDGLLAAAIEYAAGVFVAEIMGPLQDRAG